LKTNDRIDLVGLFGKGQKDQTKKNWFLKKVRAKKTSKRQKIQQSPATN
jgi:hypothetical protein